MWTVPVHASLFTGLPLQSHGANAKWIWLDNHYTTAAEWFSEAGYDTWAFSANPYLSASSNLLQGFETIEYSWLGAYAEASAQASSAKLIDRDASMEIGPAWKPTGHGHGWPEHLTAFKDAGAVSHEALVAWLDQRTGDAPFFAYVNYLEAHHPRIPSLASREALLDAETMERGFSTDVSLFNIMSFMEERHTYTDAELDAARGVYDASVRDLDAVTGDLLDDLERRGVLDDTVVVLLSDHGENLGEHGLYDHRWSVHQTLIHVPLVIRYPAGVPAERVRIPVSTQGLFGELCRLTGVVCPEGLPVLDRSGRVFSELIQPTPRIAAIKNGYEDLDPYRWSGRYHVVIDGTDKLVRSSLDQHMRFDLGVDAEEENNLIDTPFSRLEELKLALVKWKTSQAGYDRGKRGHADRPGAALRGGDTSRQLELLGYAEPEEEVE
jgi:arylsulfatase A-like enzyme